MNVLDLGQFCGFFHEPVANHFDLCTFSGTSLLETRIFKLTKPEALAEEFVTSMGTNFSRMHHWTDRLASFPWKPRDRTGSSEIVKKMISQGFQLSSLSLSLFLFGRTLGCSPQRASIQILYRRYPASSRLRPTKSHQYL